MRRARWRGGTRDSSARSREAPAATWPGRAPAQGGKRRLITTDVEHGILGQDWMDFCRATGVELGELQDGSLRLCSHYFLALELARAGQGVALVPEFLASREIRSGNVVTFHDAIVPSGRTYCLCIKETRAGEAKLQKLSDWLVEVAGRDADTSRVN